MSLLSKISDWRMKIFLWIGLPVIAFMGLGVASADVVPAWKAKGGSGTVGTFTAVREECGRRSCEIYGNWVAKDGSRTLTDVGLYDEPDSLTEGGQVEAVDTGARNGVFATSGGMTYLFITGFTLVGAAAAIGWIVFVIRTVRRRLAGRAQPAATVTSG